MLSDRAAFRRRLQIVEGCGRTLAALAKRRLIRSSRHQFLRYVPDLHEAVQAGECEQAENQQRNMGPVGLEHHLNDVQLPEHRQPEGRQAHQDEPAKQRQVVSRLGQCGQEH